MGHSIIQLFLTLFLFSLFCFGCTSEEEALRLKHENAYLKRKLEQTETKLKVAYRESIKSRLPGAIWLEGNGAIRVNQGYIQQIKFNIFNVSSPRYTATYFASKKVKPKYYLHFYDRFGKCVGSYYCGWKLRTINENESREDKPRELDSFLGTPAFFTVTFLK